MKLSRQRLKRVVLGGGLLPFVIEPSGLSNGALPAPMVANAAWAVTSGVIANTPTETEILTNGNLETWTSPTDAANWSEFIAGASTVNQESVTVHSGSTNAARFDVDASNSIAGIYQTPALTFGDWIRTTAWMRASTTSKSAQLTHTNQIPETNAYALSASEFQKFTHTSIYRLAAGYNIQIRRTTGTSANIYVDDVSTVKLTKATLFSTFDARVSDVTVKANWTEASGDLAGVVLNTDATMQNYVIVFFDRVSSGMRLVKVVNGVAASVLSTAAEYAADATIECRKSGTSYSLYYNGVQVGATQTIEDAGIINNKLHGLFSTNGTSTCSRFYCGVGADMIDVPSGETIADYLHYVSTGDNLVLSGTYTLGVAESGFSSLVSGTASRRTKVFGNGATITGGAVGINLTNKSYVAFQDMTLINQTGVVIQISGTDNVSFLNVSSENSPGTILDTWKIRNCDNVEITGGHSTLLTPSSTLTCDGVEFWGPCNDCTVTNHIVTGYANGPGDNDGHAFEVYGTSPAEICDNIQFVGCEATGCVIGFTSEGGAGLDALHTNVVCNHTSSHGNTKYGYGGIQGATLYRSNVTGDNTGNGTAETLGNVTDI